MNLAIVKYNAGNIQSVLYALERLGIQAEVTDDAEKLKVADKVIFPGVGAASSAMQSLKANNLDRVIKDLKQPVFGICVGMQLLCNHSEESDTECLGIVPVNVRKFSSPFPSGRDGDGLKVPQIGWNNIYNLKTDLFKNNTLETSRCKSFLVSNITEVFPSPAGEGSRRPDEDID